MKRFNKVKPVTVVEMVLSYISIGWAFVLFSTPTLFESSPSWNQIEMIANSEWVVGIIVLACALTKVVGIALNNIKMRRIGLLMSTGFWIMIATSMLIATGSFTVSTGFICYSGIAIMSLWTSKEVTSSDDTKR